MSDTRAKPEAGLLSRMAWSSLREALDNRARLFICIAAANVVLGIGERWATEALTTGSLAAVASAPIRGFLALGVLAVHGLATTVLLATVAVAVHRQILLEQSSGALGGRVWPFALWTITLQIAFAMLFLPAYAIGVDILKLASFAAVVFLGTRLILVFPSVAIDAPTARLQDRIAASWEATRGLFWMIFLSLFVALLPLGLLVLVPTFASYLLVTMSFLALEPTHALSVTVAEQVTGAIGDMVEPFQIALTAGVASWVYMWIHENPPEAPILTQPSPET